MSEENVELVRAAYAAGERGDLAYILDHADPDVEIVEPPGMPGAGTYHGHQGLRDAINHWTGEWDELKVEVERIIDAGDRVVCLLHEQARGRLSGAPVEVHVAHVHTMRNGKLVRWQMFATWEQALDAVGLGSRRCLRPPGVLVSTPAAAEPRDADPSCSSQPGCSAR